MNRKYTDWIGHSIALSRQQGAPGMMLQAAVALFFAILATAVLISLFLAPKPVIMSVAGGLLFVVFFMLSGNQRLFCLWGLLLTAPFTLSKAFWPLAHMGGASAIMLDLDDPFIVGLLAFIVRDHLKGFRKVRWSPILFWWGGLIAIGIADLLLGPLRHLAALEIIRMSKCYLLFFVIINEVRRARQIMHVFYALFVGLVLQTATAFVQFVFKVNFGLQKLGEPDPNVVANATKSVYLGQGEILRVGGLMTHPNVLAGYLAIMLPICIALLFSRISGLAKFIIGIVATIGIADLIFTLSRSGWLAFGVGFVLLFLISLLHQRLRLRYMLARVAVILVCVIGLIAASGAILKRVTQSDPGALKFRYEMMDIAWQMIEERPIFGMGTNSFVAALPHYGKYHGRAGVIAAYGDTWPIVHDSFLITWSEQGTVGFLFLIGVYGCVLWMGAQSARYMHDDVIYAMNLGACCGIVANMVDGIGSFFIDLDNSERVFWMVVALIVAINYWTIANRPARTAQAPARLPGIKEALPAASAA